MTDDLALTQTQNWASYSHEALYESVHVDNDPARAGALADEWHNLAAEVKQHAQRVVDGIKATVPEWQGPAGTAARDAMAQLVDWSQQAAQTATNVGRHISEQSQVMAKARAEMPEPVKFDWQAMLSEGFARGGLAGFAQAASDVRAKNEQANAAHEQAVAVMSNMEAASKGLDSSTPQFVPPPNPLQRTEAATAAQPTLRRVAQRADDAPRQGQGADGTGTPGTATKPEAPALPAASLPGGASGAGGNQPGGGGVPPLTGVDSATGAPRFDGSGGSGSAAGMPGFTGPGGSGSGAGMPGFTGSGGQSGAGMPGGYQPAAAQGGDDTFRSSSPQTMPSFDMPDTPAGSPMGTGGAGTGGSTPPGFTMPGGTTPSGFTMPGGTTPSGFPMPGGTIPDSGEDTVRRTTPPSIPGIPDTTTTGGGAGYRLNTGNPMPSGPSIPRTGGSLPNIPGGTGGRPFSTPGTSGVRPPNFSMPPEGGGTGGMRSPGVPGGTSGAGMPRGVGGSGAPGESLARGASTGSGPGAAGRVPPEELAGRGGASGRPGQPGMAGGMGAGGAHGKREEDKERKSAPYVQGEDIFRAPGDDLPPPVIGMGKKKKENNS